MTEEGYYVDFNFTYGSGQYEQVDVSTVGAETPEFINGPEIKIDVKFSVYVGHRLDDAYQAFKFICNNNLQTENINYIGFRYAAGADNEVFLSRRSASGVGDW